MTVSLVVFGLLLLALAWLLLGGRDRPAEPTAHRRTHDEIDHTELDQAEREVQNASDEDRVRDWGPGASKPPLA